MLGLTTGILCTAGDDGTSFPISNQQINNECENIYIFSTMTFEFPLFNVRINTKNKKQLVLTFHGISTKALNYNKVTCCVCARQHVYKRKLRKKN